ncbi:MAG: hypothetical protein AAF219_11245 [Myxococcota bacterium]
MSDSEIEVSTIWGLLDSMLPTERRYRMCILLSLIVIPSVFFGYLLINVRHLGFTVYENKVYLSAPDEEDRTQRYEVHAFDGWQRSSIVLKKGRDYRLVADGKALVAAHHSFRRIDAVKSLDWRAGSLVNSEFAGFWRTYAGPTGHATKSPTLQDCRVNLNANWGQLLFEIHPNRVVAGAPEEPRLEPGRATSVYRKETSLHVDQNSRLWFLVNDAALAPTGPSKCADMYRELEAISDINKHDETFQLGSLERIFYEDNVGSFRVRVVDVTP